jgi:CHAT domain-containing protein/Tfp pilus assembly protein PilF
MTRPKNEIREHLHMSILVFFVTLTAAVTVSGQNLSPKEFRGQVINNVRDGNFGQVQQLISTHRSETFRFIEALIDSSITKRAGGSWDAGKVDWELAYTLAKEYLNVFNDSYYLERVNRNQNFNTERLREKADIILLKEQGKNEFYQGRYQSALKTYTRALQLAQEMNDPDEKAALIGNIGAAHFYLGDFDKALDYYLESLSLLEEIGDIRRVGNRLGNIANVYSDKSDYPDAIEYFERAIEIREMLNDRRGMATDLNNIGLVYYEMGFYKKALSHYQKAYEINKSISNTRGMGKNLANIANVHIKFGDYSMALTVYQENIEIRKQKGDRKGEGIDLGNIGIVYQSLGDFTRATSYYQMALAVQRETGYKEGEAYQLGRIAELHSMKGEYAEAIRLYNEALQIHKNLGHIHGEATWLEALCGIYLAVGDYKRSLENLQQVLELHQSINNRSGAATTLTKIGRVYQEMDEYKLAKKYYDQSLKIHQELGEKSGESLNYIYLAYLSEQQKDSVSALTHLKKSEKIADEIGEKALQIQVQQQLGDFHRTQNHVDDAHRAYEKGLLISEDLDDPELKWQLYYGQGKLWESQGDDERAYYNYRAAVSSIEDIRMKAEIEEFRSGIVHNRFDTYRSIIQLLIRMDRIEEAFYYMERSRSRNLLDLLGNTKIPANDFKTQEQIEEEQALRGKINILLTKILEETRHITSGARDAAIEDYNRELQESRKEYKHLLIDLKLRNPAYASMVSVEPPATSEIQNLLDEECAILEYLVNEETLVIFVLSKNKINAITVPAEKTNIRGKLMLFHGTAVQNLEEQKLLEKHWIPPLGDLYKILIKPVLDSGHLANIKHLVIIPHDLVHYVPFQALIVHENEPAHPTSDPHFLIEDYEISYAPSASVLKIFKKKSSNRENNLLLMAPRITELPMSEYEVKEIATNFGTGAQYYLQQEATESIVKQKGPEFKKLHFATTAVFNNINPLFSRLELAECKEDDGNLEVHEILGLNLNANLITISACQTAVGSGYFVTNPQGDDLVSLSRAFLYAGSPSVVASLWEINDQSTAVFMTRFYEHLTKMDKGEALTQTQRDMISGNIQPLEKGKNYAYSHPYHWAPFVLIGDWE